MATSASGSGEPVAPVSGVQDLPVPGAPHRGTSALWGVELVLARCWACAGDQLFEPVGGEPDDSGAEFMCARCGDALLLGVLTEHRRSA